MTGALLIKTPDGPQQVFDYYKQLFQEQEYEIVSQSMSSAAQGSFGVLSVDLGQGRTIDIGIVGQAGACQITLSYNAKPE